MRVLALVLLALTAGRQPPVEGRSLLQDKPKVTAIRGAKVYTAVGAPLEGGTLLIEGSRIAAVGKELAIPPDATLIDATGKVVIPGLIDAASRLFLEAGDRGAGSAEQNVLDALDLYQRDWKEALEQGVTTVYVGPVSGGPVNGLGAVLHLDAPRTVLSRSAALKLTLGAAAGDTSTAAQRYESYQQLKQAFEGARQYLEAKDKYRKELEEYGKKKQAQEAEKKPKVEGATKEEAKPTPPAEPQKPRADPRNEILARTLDAKNQLPVRIEVHMADAIRLAIRLAEEFKLKLILENATEGYAALDALRSAGCPVVAGPVFRYGAPQVDYLNHSVGCVAELVKWGAPVAIGSFGDEKAGHSGAGASRFLAEAAAFAASKGLTREQALAAITLEAAKIVGLEKSLGSLQKGKTADLVILSREPFEAGTVVEMTIVGGEIVYKRPTD